MLKKTKRILVVPNAEITKLNNDLFLEKGTGEFLSELVSLGNSVTVFGQIIPSENKIHVYNLNRNVVRIKGLIRKKSKLINYLFLYSYSIIEILKADYIYLFYPSSFKFVAFICKLFNKKYGLYIRGMNDLDSLSSKYIIKNASLALSVSDNFKDLVNSYSKKVVSKSIKPMIPFSKVDMVADKSYLNKEFYNLLYLGRMTDDKGVIELLNAVDRLKFKFPNKFKLTLVGDGEYFEQLKVLAKDLQLNSVVSFEGAVFEKELIKQYFLNADIYILPSYHEGFPRTLYESMIFGVPIITTFVGGISALMIDNVNCLEILPKSVDSIVEKIDFSIKNYNKMGKLSKNASRLMADIFEDRKFSHAEELNCFITNNV